MDEGFKEWPKISQMEDRKPLADLLGSAPVGTVSTYSKARGPWAANVFFTADDGLNIYFMSSTATRHMQDIFENNQVAFAVFMPAEKAQGVHIGAQISGIALPVTDDKKAKVYADRMRKLAGDGAWVRGLDQLTRVDIAGVAFMRIRPTEAFYVNTSMFGSERKQVKLD